MQVSGPQRGNIYVLVVFAFQILSNVALTLLYTLAGGRLTVEVQMILNQIFSFLLPFFFYLILTNAPLRETLALKKLSIGNLAYIFAMSLLIQPVMMVISSISSFYFGNQATAVLNEMLQTSPLALLLAMAVFPAVCEEITYRGVVYSNYKGQALWKAALVNGLFFGLMHTNLNQFSYAFLLGAIFCCFVHYTGSIFSSMLAHFIINGTQVLQYMMLLPSYGEEEQIAFVLDFGILLVYAVIILIFGSLFYFVFNSFKNYNIRLRQKEDEEREGETASIISSADELLSEGGKAQPFHTSTFIIAVIFYIIAFILFD